MLSLIPSSVISHTETEPEVIKTMVFEPNLNLDTIDSSVEESKKIHGSIIFGDFPSNSFDRCFKQRILPNDSRNAFLSPKRFEAQDAEYLEIKGGYYIINQKDTDLYQGFLKYKMVSAEKPVSFLSFKDDQEASRMHDCLMSCNHANIVRSFGIFPHGDKEWLVAVEPIEPIESYFMRVKKDWESKSYQGSIATYKASWWNYINDDFIDIFQKVKRALCTLIEDEKFINQWIIYTNNPEKCLMISIADNRVKFLPNGKANKSKGIDIDKMQQFLSHFIGLPFGLNDVAADSDFKLPNELLSFLHNLSNDNLKFVGPKFLLGAPFGWQEIEGYKFIINLDDLLKRHVIEKKFLDEKLQCGHEAGKWASNLPKYPVLSQIYNFSGLSNGTTAKYVLAVDVVRYCSNVYRHYNDENYKGVRTKFLERSEIEKELRAAIPDLYVNLYDALLLYAKSNPIKRETIFEKLLSSEDL